MIWPDHSREIPKGEHAIFGGSVYSWTNIDMEDEEAFENALRTIYYNKFATDIGTIMHAWAAERIEYRLNPVKSDAKGLLIYIMEDFKSRGREIPRFVASYYVDRCFPNLMAYIKDANGFRLDPEVKLMYTPDFYGSADAILYKKGESLRIHDLKTGVMPAKLRQLEIYAAYCCLDLGIDPNSVEIELRIYQNDDILIGNPPGDTILELMNRVKKTRMVFEKIKKEG